MGKLLLPTSKFSFSNLNNLYDRAKRNGVEINKISKKEIEDLEPNVNCQFDHGLCTIYICC